MKKLIFSICLLVFIIPPTVFAQDSTSTSLSVKIAPGELLPVSVKLSNFGGGNKVDVTITYGITSDKNIEIYKTSDTVAVETTNNFVKTIQIPFNTSPGIYTEKTSIAYQGQAAPATSEFKFNVERKIFGVFQSQFLLYGGITLLISILMVFIGYWIVKNRTTRFTPIDYSNIPKHERVFYELISDTILGMRQKVGDRALDVVSQVEGITLDENTGRVVKLTRTPSKIIAELVAGYEKILGEKVSFSFREPR